MDKTLNLEVSRELAEQVGAVKKECWRNALMALLLEDRDGWTYVEGHVFNRIPFAHGWVESKTEIFDPTLILSPNAEKTQYFPAVHYTAEEAEQLLNKSLPAVENTPYHGWDNPAWKASFDAALAAAQS